jgi:methylmalonyl-CoA mutase C-terminal domain/subunit
MEAGALQEDVQVIGNSIRSGAHLAIVPRVVQLSTTKETGGLCAAASGTNLDRDAATQENMEVSAVMELGAPVENAADQVRRTFSPNA